MLVCIAIFLLFTSKVDARQEPSRSYETRQVTLVHKRRPMFFPSSMVSLMPFQVDGFVDSDFCYSSVKNADENGDNRLTNAEFVSLAQDLAPTGLIDDVLSFDDLPFLFRNAFTTLACLCQIDSFGGDSTDSQCCTGSRAHLRVPTVKPSDPAAATEDVTYLYNICSLLETAGRNVLGSPNPTAFPTGPPVTVQPTTIGPTMGPTAEPTEMPVDSPTVAPSGEPTPRPTTTKPTPIPTEEPGEPTPSPVTALPTSSPTEGDDPTQAPTPVTVEEAPTKSPVVSFPEEAPTRSPMVVEGTNVPTPSSDRDTAAPTKGDAAPTIGPALYFGNLSLSYRIKVANATTLDDNAQLQYLSDLDQALDELARKVGRNGDFINVRRILLQEMTLLESGAGMVSRETIGMCCLLRSCVD